MTAAPMVVPRVRPMAARMARLVCMTAVPMVARTAVPRVRPMVARMAPPGVH